MVEQCEAQRQRAVRLEELENSTETVGRFGINTKIYNTNEVMLELHLGSVYRLPKAMERELEDLAQKLSVTMKAWVTKQRREWEKEFEVLTS